MDHTKDQQKSRNASTSKRKRNQERGAKDTIVVKPPVCSCKQPATRRTVQKEGPTKGRMFWGCGQWPNGCKFFAWYEAPAPSVGTTAAAATTSSPHSNEPGKGIAIKLITMNVAEFKPHNNAPSDFQPQQAFQEELEQYRPDILALQELPSYCQSFPNYDCVGTATSHCGLVGLFIRKQFLKEHKASLSKVSVTKPLSVDMMAPELPAVFCSITLQDDRELVVGSCHLEPYKDGTETRLAQVASMSDATDDQGTMILGGDMNMRGAEDAAVEAIGKWKDAWKEGGSVQREAYTWNSKVNQYHADAFAFYCRFDRVYLRNVQHIQAFKLVACEPMTNKGAGAGETQYYLSDHFGILTTVVV